MDPQDYSNIIASLDDDLSLKKTDEPNSLSKRFQKERTDWSVKINDMNKKLNNMETVQTLLLEIYTERQRAVEFYHYLISLLIDINKKYRKEYMLRYEYYTYQSQQRFPNENLKTQKILTDIEEIVEKKDLLEVHSKFIENTIKSIDGLIWAITRRIEIEQISRGK
jgi:hypothetical protein